MKKVFKTVLKTITMYTFFNAIIAILHDLIKFIEFGPVRVISYILYVFVTVFSYVLFPLLPVILGLVIYYFIRLLFFKDKHESFKYLFINCFSFLTMVYFFAQVVAA